MAVFKKSPDGGLLRDKSGQCSERGIGLEACAHRAHLGDAPGGVFRGV